LVAALIAVAVAVPLLLAARRRRSSWNTQLTAATGEIVWFAGQLIPQLQQDGSRDQVAGAWQVTRDRVTTLEDTLTGLQSTAPNEQEAARSRDLRDAVRDARTRIDAAAETTGPPVDITMTRYALGAARATLETALANSEPGHPPVDGDLEPWLPISAKACGAEHKDGLTSGSFNSAMPGSSGLTFRSPLNLGSGEGGGHGLRGTRLRSLRQIWPGKPEDSSCASDRLGDCLPAEGTVTGGRRR